MTRTEAVIKNSVWGVTNKVINLILNFASRTIFIYFLGVTYLGVNGLYSEIFAMLSLTELGFGTALLVAMYKPIADNDRERILQLLDFYKKTYRVIALIIAGAGIALIPFLQYIVKGADSLTLFNLRLYFIIYLANTVIGYFVSYKFSYVNALQKNYMAANFNLVTSIVTIVAQCVAIWLTKSFLVYLLVQTVLLAGSKFIKAAYFNRKFPILKEKPERVLTKEERKPIFKEVKDRSIHKFSTVAIHSTDNIIIATLTGLGVTAVGLVSNYTMLINAVTGFVVIFFSALITSFGNLVATSTTEHYRRTFLELNFVNFWLYGFCSIAFLVLIPPFITLWLGGDFLIDNASFLLIVLNCYLLGQFTVYNNVREAKGNFGKDKWMSLSEALINLVVSMICAHYLGLVGVYIGTIASKVFYTIARPIVTYRFMTDKSPWDYFSRFIKYFVATVFAGAVTYFVCSHVLVTVNIWTFLLAAVVVAALPNMIFLALFFRDAEFKSVVKRALNIIGSVLKKDEKP